MSGMEIRGTADICAAGQSLGYSSRLFSFSYLMAAKHGQGIATQRSERMPVPPQNLGVLLK